ncbi:DUF4398 domain-containing protein [Azomonas macrocytogenes]|uniref:Putative lipoprotein YmbA n=1 Tax=Azomonas macrocytogenes TaxID=69962 RepID=A0A839SX86_AZOMA|nr:DUF4398 domain-containing protein [Azomonas macrocytogenes]MBB3101981.1 putative lipoprotein YmbA [Azomonas macrocytogenes]
MKETTNARPAPYLLGRLTALALSGMILAGCSGNPPKEQFALTDAAIQSAVSADATQFAPVEMRSAQEKWRQAGLAMQTEDYEVARTLAEQAEWDARVAERKANVAKIQKAVDDARKGVEDLREEGQRQIQ